MASRCGAAPYKLNFGDSVARLVRGLSTFARDAQQIVNRISQIVNGMVRLPGIAPGRAPWRGTILLLNHDRKFQLQLDSPGTILFPGLSIVVKYVHWVTFVALMAATGCDHGLFPEKVSLSDPRIQPMLEALGKVDRVALGFTPISTNADIRLELASGRAYDAMLHVSGGTSRTIAFRKIPSGYRWTFEQESHEGPGWYQSVDGTFREFMLIEYQTEPVDGIPTNQLYIRYTGSDTNLTDRKFTLAEVRPILEKWKTSPVEPQPPDLPGAGFDPAPAMFVLFMLLALLAACCLALIVGTMCLAVVTVMLAGGILSASVLIGILQRSVSAGFRALFIQLGAVAGMTGGAIAVCVVTWITQASWNSPLHWVLGITLGLLIGLLFAWIFNKVWSRIAQTWAKRLENRN